MNALYYLHIYNKLFELKLNILSIAIDNDLLLNGGTFLKGKSVLRRVLSKLEMCVPQMCGLVAIKEIGR
jgi:hypothetical protein